MPRYATTKPKHLHPNKYYVRGYKKFIDPFPIGFGTLPEKILYRALSERNIPFYYLNDIEINIPEIGFDQFFQADFILPTVKTIIEVQGAHWHSMPATMAADALKLAYYEQIGWRPLAWWDFDIIGGINQLFSADPILTAASHYDSSDKSGELTPTRRTKTDTSKGIRTLNRKRGARLSYRKKSVTIKTTKPKIYGTTYPTTKR